MTDPYVILGISPNATDEEVKNAYHAMARKYHPDRYADSNLSDLANEKMQQVNAAYSQICEERKNGTSRSAGRNAEYETYANNAGYRSSGQSTYGRASAPRYAEVRQDLSLKRFREAEEILRNTPSEQRGAEWHYLMGVLCYNTGNRVDAQQYASAACQMAPENPEYARFYNAATGRGQGNPYQSYQQREGCSTLDICSLLMCTECFCSCCFGH